MEISFKNNKLEKSFTSDKDLSKEYGTMAKKVKARYEDLKAADNLQVVAQYPAMRLHTHKGNNGIWSIDIIKTGEFYSPSIKTLFLRWKMAE